MEWSGADFCEVEWGGVGVDWNGKAWNGVEWTVEWGGRVGWVPEHPPHPALCQRGPWTCRAPPQHEQNDPPPPLPTEHCMAKHGVLLGIRLPELVEVLVGSWNEL